MLLNDVGLMLLYSAANRLPSREFGAVATRCLYYAENLFRYLCPKEERAGTFE